MAETESSALRETPAGSHRRALDGATIRGTVTPEAIAALAA